MDYKVEKQEGAVKIVLTVLGDEWREEMNKTYLATRGKYNVPGFRKGHAPRGVLEKMFGKGVFFDDTIERCFSKGYTEVMQKEEWIYPVDDPKIDIDEFNDEKVVISAVVTVKPEVKLGAYKGLEIPKAEVVVTEDEINAQIDHMREHASRFVNVTDRAVADGDIVTLDYSGSVDGVKFEGGTAQNQQLTIGSHSFIPGFEEKMIGMNIGETKDLDLKFPEEYHAADLAGKDVVFNVTVHDIKVKEMPELGDEFVRDVSEFDTLDALKADVRSKIEKNKQEVADRDADNEMLRMIAEGAEIGTVPQCMINREVDYHISNMEAQLRQFYGMSMSDYLKATGLKLTDMRRQYTDRAVEDVKRQLVLQEILETEKLTVSDKEVEDMFEQEAEKAKAQGRDVQEHAADLRRQIKNELLMEKLLSALRDWNKFVPKKEDASSEKKESKKAPAKKSGSSGKKAEKKSDDAKSAQDD